MIWNDLEKVFKIEKMLTLNLESDWEKVKALLMEAAPQLTEDDLQFNAGEDEAVIEKIAKKLNKSTEHTKGWIESVSHTTGKAS